jgi:predicted nucleotidyltransferase component of viral defense system
MPSEFLHLHKDFKSLIGITANAQNIDEPSLVEKDYWIMHCLWGLKKAELKYELKGGTSLSKGFQIIQRFSEDIDIHIEPDGNPLNLKVCSGKNQNKTQHIQSRKEFFDTLAAFLKEKIPGIVDVERDTAFDDEPDYRNGGIRLRYNPVFDPIEGVKDGILLEVGFDKTTPNQPKDITSWAFEYAKQKDVQVTDNRAFGVFCYDLRFTFVEKLQTVRHYYDIYHLLSKVEVQDFIGTSEYEAHKLQRFGRDDKKVANSGAFVLTSDLERKRFEESYKKTKTLYYRDQPSLSEILDRVSGFLDRL